VSNCLTFSCCTMIRGIASHAPSVLFLPSIVFALRASLTLFHRVYKFPEPCMFPHSEYRTRLVLSHLLDSSDKDNPVLCIPRSSGSHELCHSVPLLYSIVFGIVPVHISVPTHSGNPFRSPYEIPWTRLKVGAAHELKPFPGTLRTSEFRLNLRRTRVA
jgi:hypothetical protein